MTAQWTLLRVREHLMGAIALKENARLTDAFDVMYHAARIASGHDDGACTFCTEDEDDDSDEEAND